MAFLVEAYLDPEADARVRRLWHTLNERGVSDSNLRNDSRPHLTLVTSASVDPDALALALAGIAQRPAFSLRLRGLGVFPGGRSTLYLAPVPTFELLALHRDCADAVAGCGGTPSGFDAPGAWSPHVSLARRLRPESLGAAFDALRDQTVEIDAHVVRLGLLRDRPIVDLGFFGLAPDARPIRTAASL